MQPPNHPNTPRCHIDRRTFLTGIGATSLTVAIGACASGSTAEDASGATTSTQPESTTTTTTTTDAPETTVAAGGFDRTQRLQRLYVPMRDDTRIAIDVWLPEQAATATVPTVIRATRYGRSYLVDSGNPDNDVNALEALRWADQGYALVIVDARGSGASFGSRPDGELSTEEIEDYGEVIDWVARSEWSTGRIGAYGVSYDGNAAEMMARLANPNLTAVAPQFSDYRPYRHLVYPGGAYLEGPMSQWLLFNDALDGVDGSIEQIAELFEAPVALIEAEVPFPSPVDGVDGPSLAEEARQEHQDNLNLLEALPTWQNHDDNWGALTVPTYEAEIEAAAVPMLVQASWYDAGTAAGTLERFADLANHQEVWLGPWSHGGEEALNPSGIDTPLDFEDLAFPDQFARVVNFFDRFVKGDEEPGTSIMRYTTLGASGWSETGAWPPPGVSSQELFLAGEGLVDTAPQAETNLAIPNVGHSSGESTRWAMNVAGETADYSNWQTLADARRSFRGAAQTTDSTIIGFPVVEVPIRSTTADAVIHAYLEYVGDDEAVHYLTEGVLRLSHRAHNDTDELRTDRAVSRTFNGVDRQDMEPGVTEIVRFELLPLSVNVPAGAALQLSFASTDLDNFARYGDGQLEIVVGNATPARLALSIVE